MKSAPLALTLVLLLPLAARGDGAPGQQVEVHWKLDGQPVDALLSLPAEYDAEGEKQWPLMLFLHGRGESRGPLSIVAKWGPPRMAARGEPLPYVLISPQCPAETNWSSEEQQQLLVKLLDHMQAEYRTDPSRVYLTGLSMGGYGSWTLAAAHPERFAAVAPVCGGGDPSRASRLTGVPIWAFHGSQDPVVPLSRSADMVEAIRAAGGEKVRFTTLEHIGHNSWSSAYATPELYQWFEQQTLPGDK